MNRIAMPILALLIILLSSCGEDPTIPADSNGFTIGGDGEQLLARIPIGDGVIEVRSRNLTWDSDQQIAAFDVYLFNKSTTTLEGPAQLVVASVSPVAVEFANPDGYTGDGLPYKEYLEEFGGDGVLSPHELSGTKSFEFSVGEYRSFAAVFELAPTAGGTISGIVFRDDDENGVQGEYEPGLAGVSVLVRTVDSDNDVAQLEAVTSSDGMYQVVNLQANVYSVHVEVPETGTATTPVEIFVTLLRQDDGVVSRYADAHFGILLTNTPEELVIERDFDDGQLPPWDGNALMVNRSGVLEMVARGSDSRWELFDQRVPGVFTSGTIEFDAKFPAETSMLSLKGHPIENLNSLEFGPRMHFREGQVFAWNAGFVDTGHTYTPGVWYRVRCEFENNLGDRGRYSLFLTELEPDAEEVAIGEYDYEALGGRFVDIVLYGFQANPLDQVYSTSLFVDNLRLEVR